MNLYDVDIYSNVFRYFCFVIFFRDAVGCFGAPCFQPKVMIQWDI